LELCSPQHWGFHHYALDGEDTTRTGKRSKVVSPSGR
jgi:hypothetical protein